MSDDDFLRVEANDCPMSSCAAPPGSPCRTGRGKVAAQYHTARFRLVPQLAKALSVPVPPLRKPGTAWTELQPGCDLDVGAGSPGGVALGDRPSLDAIPDDLRANGAPQHQPDLARQPLIAGFRSDAGPPPCAVGGRLGVAGLVRAVP